MLTPKDEDILKAIHTYRYVTTLDIAHLLYRPTYLPYVRKRLSRLAGSGDLVPDQCLCRFWLPSPTGNRERIFTLGEKGRAFLAEALGHKIDWRFQPAKLKFISYSAILHQLLLTRFLIAAHWWCRSREHLTILEERTSYELQQLKKAMPVVPDAWLLFGNDNRKFALLFELDRGMEFQQKFKAHVKGRIDLIRSGEYQKVFGVPGVIIAYVTTGQTPEYRNTQVRAMNAWTQEVLTELNLQNWGGIFRFASVEFDNLYDQAGNLFEEPVWLRPDSRELVRLFE